MCDSLCVGKVRSDPPLVYLDRGEINQGYTDVIILQLILIVPD